MSGEEGELPPDIRTQIGRIRADIRELGRRVTGAQQGLRLNDLEDVVTDGLVDPSIVLADGDTLMWSAAEGIWKPGAGGGGGDFWQFAAGQLFAEPGTGTPSLERISMSPGGNLVFDVFDDGGLAADAYFDLFSRGWIMLDSDYAEIDVDNDFYLNATENVYINADNGEVAITSSTDNMSVSGVTAQFYGNHFGAGGVAQGNFSALTVHGQAYMLAYADDTAFTPSLTLVAQEAGSAGGGGGVSVQLLAADLSGVVRFTEASGQPNNISPVLEVRSVGALAPAAAPAGFGRLFMRTTGGKVQFVARFPTGAVQVIATEP